MPRGSNPEKMKEWTDRLKRLEKSKQTVSEFCLSEGVSVPSLYHGPSFSWATGSSSSLAVTCRLPSSL